MRRLFRPVLFSALIVVAAGLSGCDRILGGGHASLDRMEIFLAGSSPEARLGTWTRSGGWDVAALPAISLSEQGGRLSIGIRIFDEDGVAVPLVLGGEYFVRYRLAPGAPQGVLNLDLPAEQLFFGDRVVLVGRSAGTTSVRFSLFHVNHSDGDAAPLSVTVVP
jgi:hypothetical protein